MNVHEDLLFKDECYKVVGLCMKVHRLLGRGFREVIYKDALELEFVNHGVPYDREKQFRIFYEGIELQRRFIADFIVFGAIILEIKAQFEIPSDSFRQTLNYVKVAGVRLGLIINFGESSLNFKRIICDY